MPVWTENVVFKFKHIHVYKNITVSGDGEREFTKLSGQTIRLTRVCSGVLTFWEKTPSFPQSKDTGLYE